MLWLLAVGALLNNVGLSFVWPINSIYIHEELGRSLTVAGVVLFLHSGAGALGQMAGGWLYDRVGARPILLTGLILASGSICLPAVFASWPLYVAVMITFGFAVNLCVPAVQSLAAQVWPEGGRRAFNFIYVANNAGVAVGTAVGGIVAQRSFALAFQMASLLLFLYAVFAFIFIRPSRPEQAQDGEVLSELSAVGGAERDAAQEPPVPWVPLVALFFGLLVLWLTYVQWQGPVAVHMQDIGLPLSAYSVLWTLNGLLIVLGQPLLSLAVRIFRSLSSQMFVGTLLFACAFGVMLASDQYPAFAASMMLLTAGEMFLWPAVPAAVAKLSPPSRLGFFQGFIGGAVGIGRMTGPVLGGLLYDHLPYSYLLVSTMAILVVPAVCFAIYTMHSPAEQRH